jgi:V8-like Glu-specific endopeptidase
MAVSALSYPYGAVVRITDTIGSQSWQGSGVLIAPDEVLTASHVLYSEGVGTATNITVTPAYASGSSPYGSASGSSIHYFQVDDANDLISNEQSQSDYAVIHLS